MKLLAPFDFQPKNADCSVKVANQNSPLPENRDAGKMARKRLMTEANYRKLFKALVERFGPHWTRRMKSYPKGQMPAYEEFKTRMADEFGVTPGSIDRYISWAYTTQKSVSSPYLRER